MKIISIVNKKGGVAKTTSAHNLGFALGELGKKVLLVDLDQQANLTMAMDVRTAQVKNSIYDLFVQEIDGNDEISLGEVVIEIKKDKVYLLPSNEKMEQIENKLKEDVACEKNLKNILKTAIGYDYIILDCPPAFGPIVDNALTASHRVYIPINPEFFAMAGIADLKKRIDKIKKKINEDLDIGGVFLTLTDLRTNLHSTVKDTIADFFNEKFMNTHIRKNIKIAEATLQRKPVIEYDNKCTGSDDYINLAKEIIKREEMN